MAKGIKEAIDEACKKYQVKVMETKILNRVAYKESLLNGMKLWSTKSWKFLNNKRGDYL